ncbi:SpvB/TcaC N-terminal domain-containing protein [Rhizobium acaciae]|uniref:SpvB/TcaC N-terminal domain-containing protein n=1 Tax=Rhizobium acaciae TaxID=2989736 RepID=UPI00221E5947|nr:SpvB/TcaC N-terminal domain-containing protein [Rhizobium acaciae]
MGGYVRVSDARWHTVSDALSPQELRQGQNKLYFLSNDFGQNPAVRNAQLVLWSKDFSQNGLRSSVVAIRTEPLEDEDLATSGFIPAEWSPMPPPRVPPGSLTLLFPLHAEYYDTRALIRGYSAPDAKIYINGRATRQRNGAFETVIALGEGTERSAEVVAVRPDGTSERRIVPFVAEMPSADLSEPQVKTISLSSNNPAAMLFGVKLSVGENLAQAANVSLTCLRIVDTPALDALENLNGACTAFRVEQSGQAAITLRMPAIVDKLPNGFEPSDTRAISYDTASNTWAIVPESFLDFDNKQTVVTLRDRSSIVTSGILPAPRPDAGEPLLHKKGALSDLASRLEPLAGMVNLNAPEPNPYGSANLKLPVMLRPVRGANEPRFALTYNSQRGNGLAGDGWTLEVPMISVETKWGVPEYSKESETDTYVYQGEELIAFKDDQEQPAAYRNNFTEFPIKRDSYVFKLRRESLFAEFIRHGDTPSNYWWEIVYKNGNREYYGGLPDPEDPNGSHAVEAAIRRKASGEIFDWGLTRAEDPNGNFISYTWKSAEACAPVPCVTSLVPSGLIYNQHPIITAGALQEIGITSVEFGWEIERRDRVTTGRTGIAVLQRDRLKRIDVTYKKDGQRQEYARYRMSYSDPAPETMEKSLLASIRVEVPETDDCRAPCSSQTVVLAYHERPKTFERGGGANSSLAQNLKLNGAGILKDLTGSLLGSHSLLGTNLSSESGASLYVGVSPAPLKQLSGGPKTGYTTRSTRGQSLVADLTGDGISDIVIDDQGIKVCTGTRQPNGEVIYPSSLSSCTETEFSGISVPSLSSESSNSYSMAGEYHPFPKLIFGGAYSHNRTAQPTYLADVDGNGLIDIVSNGRAAFNQGPNTAGKIAFSSSTSFVKQPGVWAPAAAFGELAALYDAARVGALADESYFKAADFVHAWRAPSDGVVGITGAVLAAADGPKQIENTRIIVERSSPGANNSVRCSESNILRLGGGEPVWSPSTCLQPLPVEESQQLGDLRNALGVSGPLFIAVAKHDVIYFRTSGGDDAQANPGLARINIDYAVKTRALWERSTASPGVALGPSQTTQFVASVVTANGNKWDHAALRACVLSGMAAPTPTPPRCDQYGRSPNSFSLEEDLAFSAVANGDLLLDTSGFVPSTGGSDSRFSGMLRYPVGTQAVQVTLLSREMPPSDDRSNITSKQIQRDLIDDASSLVGQQPVWGKQFSIVLPGNCADSSGRPQQVAPVVAGIKVSCDTSGKWIEVSFDKVALRLCGANCSTTKRVRLEIQPQFGVRRGQPHPDVIIAYDNAGEGLRYDDLFWVNAPRIAYESRGKLPLDVKKWPMDPDGIERVRVSTTSQQIMEKPTTKTEFITPIIRGRYRKVVDADRIGPRTGKPSYQFDEIQKERDYVNQTSALPGGQPFDDPVIDEDGYRLPTSIGGCSPAPDGLCEYRIAHSFFSDSPKEIEYAPGAFAFDVTLFVNGKIQVLKYLGTVPHFACGVYPTVDFPNVHFNRPVDCGLENPDWIVADSRAPEKNIGIQFILNDGNRVRGRDLIFSFRAKPGDLLHILTAVRSTWNEFDSSFLSTADLSGSCTNPAPLPRDAFTLLEMDTLIGGDCRRWFGLRSSELRLSIEGGLGLGNSHLSRRDFARLFTPVHFYEEQERVLQIEKSSPRVATDHRGWARFASTHPAAGSIPSYERVQFEQPFSPTSHANISAASVNCSGRVVNDCSTSAAGVASQQQRVSTFPVTGVYWASDLTGVYQQAMPGATGTFWSDVDGFGLSTFATNNPCGVTGRQVVECYIGPDSDIWMGVLRGNKNIVIAQATGRVGPDDLQGIVPQSIVQSNPQPEPSEAGKPTEIIPSLPLPGLYSEGDTLSARVGVVSNLWANALSRTLYLDMNGDGYPDPIMNNTVFSTGPTGVPRDQWLAGATRVGSGHSRSSESRSLDLSVSIGDGGVTTAVTPHAAAGSGALGQTVGIDTVHGAWTDGSPATSSAKSSPDGPFGLGLSLDASLGASYTPDDFLDVNGDGLPDLVRFDQPSFLPTGPQKTGSIHVRLNLGKEFAAEQSWPLAQVPAAVNAAGGLGPQLGYNDGNGGWAGGLALSRTFSSSRQSLVDMNGDGLVDLVVPTGKNYIVYLNQGTSFSKDGLQLQTPNVWSFRDVSASESSTVDTGVTVAPAYPCGFLCFVIQNPGMRTATTLGRQIVSAQDLNGDGLVDLASTGGFYQGVVGDHPNLGFDFGLATQNYINPLGKQNKLKQIVNPSGNVIHLDYALVGNEGADNPKGIWGLSRIAIDDGFHPSQPEDGADEQISEVVYSTGKYDRWERAFLGFSKLTITDGGADCGAASCTGVELSTPLRKTVQQYRNESIYVQGLLAREEVRSVSDEKAFRAREFAYDLWSINSAQPFMIFDRACAHESGPDDKCIQETDQARNDTTSSLRFNLWNHQVARRYMPRLRIVRDLVWEKGSDQVRSMLVYDYDTHGNLTTLLNLGQVGEAAQSHLDNDDDFRADIQYASNSANPAIVDRIETMLVQRGLGPGWRSDDVMRFREAVYDARGNLVTICQYLKETAALARSRDPTFCDDATTELKAGINWEGYVALVGRVGLGPTDIIVDRRLDLDPFGNPQRVISPFNVDGERIENYNCYTGDPFALAITHVRQLRLAVDADGLSEGTPGCNTAIISSSSLADFSWSTAVSYHLGTVSASVDINGNSLGYGRDNWGRLRTVVSDWGAPNADDPRIPADASVRCKLLPAERQAACSVMLHVDYKRLSDTESVWGAVARRYVLEDLYAAGAGQDDKSAIWQATLSDGIGKVLQSNREASVCLTRGRRPDPDDKPSHLSSGPPQLCATEAQGIASGWQKFDGLGRVTAEYYPFPIVQSSADRAVDAVVEDLHLPAIVESSPRADFTYDELGRITNIKQPDQNHVQFQYSVVPGSSSELGRVRTKLIDARCAVRAFDRDARGLIASVFEAQAPPTVVPTHTAQLALGDKRDLELLACPSDAALIPGALGMAQTRYFYDAIGQLTRILRPLGNDAIVAEYDMAGRRTRISDPDRGDEVTSFDPLGNIIGRDRISIRAVAPRKIRYLFAADRVTGIRYDAAYSHLNVDYVYDDYPTEWPSLAANDQTRKWLENFAAEACRNCLGRLVAIKDASGLSVRGFDVYGQVTDTLRSISYQGAEIGRFELRNEYDTWGSLRSEHVKDLVPAKPSAACMNPRRRDDYLCDYQHSIFYSYDQAGRAAGVRLDNRNIAQFAYDEFDATKAKWTGDGTMTDFTFDVVDRRLNTMSATLFDGAAFIAARYSYDAGGNLLGYRNNVLYGLADSYLAEMSYTYDGANRLVVATGSVDDTRFEPVATNYAENYDYDLRHRMTQKGPERYVYPPFKTSSEWKPVDAPEFIGRDIEKRRLGHSHQYDGWGSLVGVADIASKETQTRRLRWDPESRLTDIQITKSNLVSKDGGTEARGTTIFNDYLYDYKGARIVKREGRRGNIPGTVANEEGWKHLYVSPSFSRRYDGPGFIHISLGAQRVASVAFNNTAQKSNRTTFYYHSELPNGSTTAITRQVLGGEHQGELYQRMAYRPFGEPLYGYRYGEKQVDIELAPNFAFAGKEMDRDTGYGYFGSRYYEARTATWLSPDPALSDYFDGTNGGVFITSNLSSFAYGMQSPVSRRDEDGRVVPVVLVAAWAIAEVALSAYDVYDTASTLIDPEASPRDKWITGVGFAAGIILPGGGYGKGGKIGAEVAEEGVERLGKSLAKEADNLAHGVRPGSHSPVGAKRPGAFAQAKRDSGIPASQQPSRVMRNKKPNGDIVPGRQYEYEIPRQGGGRETVTIRDDSAGHIFPDNPSQNRGPHFNTPDGKHYDY